MNIFEIEESLMELYTQIEENDGELTDEIAEQLEITQENFKDKIKGYVDVIKEINGSLESIKCEQNRLKSLENSKKKAKENLSNIIAKAITMFGDTTKSGGKFYDYGTGKVSVRNSVVTNVDETKQEFIERAITHHLLVGTSMATFNDCLHQYFNDNKSLVEETNEQITGIVKTIDESIIPNDADISSINVVFTTEVPLSDLFDNTDEFMDIAQIYDCNCKIKINKNNIKSILTEGGSSNLCSIEEKQSITIK